MRICAEISVDKRLCFGTGYVEPFREAECRDTVDGAEVCGLGSAPLGVVHFIIWYMIDLGGGGAVYVEPFAEGGGKFGVFRE